MPEYLSPGVYIEETNAGPRPIEGVSTTTAAFVGFAASGPANQPVLVTNWTQFIQTFGALESDGTRNPHLPGAYLSHAVFGYFNNGGTRCYVTRIVPPAKGKDSKTVDQPVTLQLPSRASKAVASLTIGAKGTTTSDISVEVTPPTVGEGDQPPAEGVFTIKVKSNQTEETYENVSIAKKHPRNVVEVVNQASKLIEITEQTTSGTLAERVPELGSFVIKASSTPSANVMPVKSNDFIGSLHDRSGIDGLEIAEDVSMICVPDLMSAYQNGLIDRDGVKAVQLAMINHCERNQNRTAILDPLPDLSPQEVKRWREDSNFDSAFGALYYPWVKVNGADGQPLAVPPSGHIAGIYARNDVERGVHKAPANEIVRGALEPVMQITKGEQDVLNPIGVNCIRNFTGMGLRLWGARTLSSNAQWRYVSVRRLFNYIEKSIERGTQWAVFEPNDEMLWSKIRRDINAFLNVVWRDGALFGNTASEAYYVKCNAETNPPEIRDRGILMIEIGVAPVKPAEFVVFRFSQYAGGGQ